MTRETIKEGFMKIIVALALSVFSLSTFAQVSYKKISEANLVSFSIGKAPEKCTSRREAGYTTTYYVATQDVTLNLADGSTVTITLKDSSRDDGEDYRDHCHLAKTMIDQSVKSFALELFAMIQGDVNVDVRDRVMVCSKKAMNVMLDGNVVLSFKNIDVPVKCP